MAIHQHLEEAVAKIEAEREVSVRVARDRVIRERINPFNADIDASLRDAIRQLQDALNANINAQQESFAKQKSALEQAAEKKKTDNAENEITAEVAIVTAKYDKAIARLRQQIDDVKE